MSLERLVHGLSTIMVESRCGPIEEIGRVFRGDLDCPQGPVSATIGMSSRSISPE